MSSEIRPSQIQELLEKVRKRNYGSYLSSIFLAKIRHISGASISFDFPVTALVGPNGSGKSTVLAAAACVYAAANQREFFFTSVVGDDSTFEWRVDYDIIDRDVSSSETLRGNLTITREHLERTVNSNRSVRFFGLYRTVPPVVSPLFMRRHLGGKSNSIREEQEVDTTHVRTEASRVLGKDLSSFKLMHVKFTRIRKKRKKPFIPKFVRDAVMVSSPLQVSGMGNPYNYYIPPPSMVPPAVGVSGFPLIDIGTIGQIEPEIINKVIESNQYLFLAGEANGYSEFNFGTGEASVLRLIYDIERIPEQSLVLIEELENGLHPLAVERLVEYLIAVAAQRKLQVIFTTHSEYALNPLPSEGIWASLEGRLIQGRLSIESLRALSGRVDKKLAIFVEDQFAQKWLQAVVREGVGHRYDEVGIYPIGGDSSALNIHLAHNKNPSVAHRSLCFLDGDSPQNEDHAKGVFRLPGSVPELAIFNVVKDTLDQNAAILTAACQRPLSCQELIVSAVRDVANTNRDPHLLFAQVGLKIGLVSEEVIRGAFLSVWIQQSPNSVMEINSRVLSALDQLQGDK